MPKRPLLHIAARVCPLRDSIDGSKFEADNRFTFFIYLRALGPGSMMDLAKF